MHLRQEYDMTSLISAGRYWAHTSQHLNETWTMAPSKCTVKTEKNDGPKVSVDDNDDTFDSDDELSDESTQDCLSWRKEDCFSDWTIIIKVVTSSSMSSSEPKDRNSDSGSKDIQQEHAQINVQEQFFTYTVHKTALAIGPRRSGYFVRLYHNGNFSEAQDCTSRIGLNELTAKTFPRFLDYMYGKPRMLFTADNATALYSLAKYFDVRRLRHEAKKFILQDMQPGDNERLPSSCCTYYKHAKLLHEDTILQAATKCFRDNIQDARVNWRMALVTDHVFWLDLMNDEIAKNGGTISNGISRKLSCYIAHFCDLHHLSPQVFQQLTHEKYLPGTENGIHPKAAVFLLESERKTLGHEENHNQKEESETCQRPSNLQIRCVNAIVRGKKKAKLTDLENRFQKFSPMILREIITRSFYGIPEEQ
jgi:BTB/POZ domain